jgi:N-acetylmuramic acid 6-phosphate etherase
MPSKRIAKKIISPAPTEKENPASRRIDCLSPLEIARLINREDQKAPLAVRSQVRAIARAMVIVRDALLEKGRLIYVGAGTSGRLGVLDAAECPPTFNVSPLAVQGIIAGGKKALWRSVEGAEDDAAAGAQAIRRLGVQKRDVVCGITASGKTPFVRGALDEARKRMARTLLIACHPAPALAPLADVVIKPVVGPEVLAGSTRMKAGTATKLVLNMISTGSMILLGKVYGNRMVDVQPTSAKLEDRALRIVVSILGCTRSRAQDLLTAAYGSAKVAIAMGAKHWTRQEAERRLRENQGCLRKIL